MPSNSASKRPHAPKNSTSASKICDDVISIANNDDDGDVVCNSQDHDEALEGKLGKEGERETVAATGGSSEARLTCRGFLWNLGGDSISANEEELPAFIT